MLAVAEVVRLRGETPKSRSLTTSATVLAVTAFREVAIKAAARRLTAKPEKMSLIMRAVLGRLGPTDDNADADADDRMTTGGAPRRDRILR